MGNKFILESKQAAETIFIEVDLSSLLYSGEAVGAAVVTAAVLIGEDTNPGAIISGSATVLRNVVRQQIVGGAVGTTYCLRVAGTTNQSNIVISLCDLSIIEPNNYGSYT